MVSQSSTTKAIQNGEDDDDELGNGSMRERDQKKREEGPWERIDGAIVIAVRSEYRSS